MKNSYLVSIIIPMYNSTEHIQHCLDSIVNQTYSKLEVIFVDDGSSTAPPKSFLERIEEDSRLSFYQKNHEGPGAARNYGMKQATGEYLLFMDSDDTIDHQAIEKLIEACGEKDSLKPDIVLFGYHLYEHNQFQADKTAPFYKGNRDEFLGQPFYTCYKEFLINAPWNKLIRRGLLEDQGILFDEQLMILEDLLFSLQTIQSCDHIVVLDEAFYHYSYLRPDALTSKFHLGKDRTLVAICTLIMEMTEAFPVYEAYYCKDTVMKIILQLLEVKQQNFSLAKKYRLFRAILSNPELEGIVQKAVGETKREKRKIALLKLLMNVFGSKQVKVKRR